MKAQRIRQFGSPDVIRYTEVELPEPGSGQLRVRVKAAGVGPWDAPIREGHSGITQTLPLTLGSDVAGIVDAIGDGVVDFRVGEEIYGVTNEQFTGGYAEFAIVSAGMAARKPQALSFIEAASVPVVAVTALQMLFDYAHAVSGQKVLVLGGAGNVGAYAVQLAKNAGSHVTATASLRDLEYVLSLGADAAVDYRQQNIEELAMNADVVIDTVGGKLRDRAFRVLRGGILVSSVSSPMPEGPGADGAKGVFFIVNVTTDSLKTIAELFDSGKLTQQVGTVLPLKEARAAHQMLAGAPNNRGKIVLRVAD